MHLTLRFVGLMNEPDLKTLDDILLRIEFEEFPISLEELVCFFSMVLRKHFG